MNRQRYCRLRSHQRKVGIRKLAMIDESSMKEVLSSKRLKEWNILEIHSLIRIMFEPTFNSFDVLIRTTAMVVKFRTSPEQKIDA